MMVASTTLISPSELMSPVPSPCLRGLAVGSVACVAGSVLGATVGASVAGTVVGAAVEGCVAGCVAFVEGCVA